MKMLMLLFLYFLCISSFALEGKTFVYFINGDWHYKGPVYQDNQIRLKDQANVIYREMVKAAKNDSKNNYVLFYDPIGRGRIFNKNWVKLRVYKKGKKVFGLGLSKPEINANSPVFHRELKDIIIKELGSLRKENSLFYYYGEHFPAYGEVTLDLGGSGSQEERGVGLQKILRLIETIGPFHTAIFHTCYLNALDYTGPLLKLVDNVILPRKAILNTHQNWNSLKADSFKDFRQQLVKDNSNSKYQWVTYGKEVLELSEKLSEVKSLVQKEYWFDWLGKQEKNDYQGIRERGDNVLFLTPLSDSAPQEVFIPFYDYINLINQYLISGDNLLDDIDGLLDKNPHLEDLYQQINFSY